MASTAPATPRMVFLPSPISPFDDAAAVLEIAREGRRPHAGLRPVPEGQRRAIVDYLFGAEQPEAAYQRREAAGGRGADEVQAAKPAESAGTRRTVGAGRRRGRGGGRGADPSPMRSPDSGAGRSKAIPPSVHPGARSAPSISTPGEIKWKVPLGEYPELSAQRHSADRHRELWRAGRDGDRPGFIGATADETIRAFDKDTGKILWQAKLPFGGNATPSIYMVGGRQFVVISAGGAKSGRPAGGSIVAFALPD